MQICRGNANRLIWVGGSLEADQSSPADPRGAALHEAQPSSQLLPEKRFNLLRILVPKL